MHPRGRWTALASCVTICVPTWGVSAIRLAALPAGCLSTLFASGSNADNRPHFTALASRSHADSGADLTASRTHAYVWAGVSAAASRADPGAGLAASGTHAHSRLGVSAAASHAHPGACLAASGTHAYSRPSVSTAPSTSRNLGTANPSRRVGNSRAAPASYWRQSLTRSRLPSPQTA